MSDICGALSEEIDAAFGSSSRRSIGNVLEVHPLGENLKGHSAPPEKRSWMWKRRLRLRAGKRRKKLLDAYVIL
jgi:hypothetical protein